MSVKRISTSQQMFERFERRKNWRRFIAILYIAIYLIYLFWRTSVINENSLTLSLLYLLAEIFGLILGLSIILKSWHYRHRVPKPLIHGLSVDIFIPTYKEPAHLIRRTLMAAKEIEYPHQTFVLDDGKRPEIKKIAEELGVKYLSRPDNSHAKAGNLNYGLSKSSADFVMVFDADHIPLPHALNIMLGFFADEKVAMVQTPQDYYNISAFQYMNGKNGALWHDQSFFYNISEPCHDQANSASCVGTGVVYRRKVLDEIGGFPTATLTEDTHTSLKMSKLGYHMVYINEAIAYGVAASDLAEYYKTRRRWGHGNIDVVKQEKIFTCKGLTFYERILHFSSVLTYFEGWQQVLLFTIPIITLICGLPPFEISIFNVLVILTFPFLSYLMLQEMGCGFSRFWSNEIFAMIRWPAHITACGALIGKKLKWSSSTKNIKGKVNWHLMLPQLAVMVMSCVALLAALYRLHGNFKIGPLFLFFKAKLLVISGHEIASAPFDIHAVMDDGYTLDLVLIAGMWVLYNIFRVMYFVYKVVNDSKNSHEFFRFAAPFPLMIEEKYGHILEISEEWLSCDINGFATKIGNVEKIKLILPRKILELKIKIEEISKNKISGKIIWDSEEKRDDLARAIYSVDWHREFLNRHAYFLTPSDLFLKSPIEQKYKNWSSLAYQDKPAVIAEFKKQKNLATIIAFEEIEQGAEINGTRINKLGAEKIKMKIIAEESLSSLVEKGLDGSITRRYTVRLGA